MVLGAVGFWFAARALLYGSARASGAPIVGVPRRHAGKPHLGVHRVRHLQFDTARGRLCFFAAGSIGRTAESQWLKTPGLKVTDFTDNIVDFFRFVELSKEIRGRE